MMISKQQIEQTYNQFLEKCRSEEKEAHSYWLDMGALCFLQNKEWKDEEIMPLSMKMWKEAYIAGYEVGRKHEEQYEEQYAQKIVDRKNRSEYSLTYGGEFST